MGKAGGVVIAQVKAAYCKQDSASPSASDLEQILRWFQIFHPWDFITAEASEGKVAWRTVKRYPLSPKALYERWRDPRQLVGVRFKKNATTSYLMVDIDIGSDLHPYTCPVAFRDMVSVLEGMGLCHYILIRSSMSEGLHLYFPLPDPLPCDGLALAVKVKLEEEGFKLASGQLELFPNVRTPQSLHHAHSLPLQAGSYVLDVDDFQPIHNDLLRFIQTWETVAKKQDIEAIRQAIASAQSVAKKTNSYSSADIIEWRDRLEETLERGWTEPGQTNQIIQEACTYARVFQGLDWDAINKWVLKTVVELPGYQQFCNHKSEIKRRVQDWVTANRQNERYYPYCALSKLAKAPKAPSNAERNTDALERIKNAIAAIVEESGQLPKGVRARQILICKTAQCSASTLRKHLVLWHPDHEMRGIVANESDELSADAKEDPNLTEACSDQSSEPEGCVTTEPERVSSSYENQNGFHENPRNLSYRDVTHPSLLSVYSVLGSADPDLYSTGLSEKESLKSFSHNTGLPLPGEPEGTIKNLELSNPHGTDSDRRMEHYLEF